MAIVAITRKRTLLKLVHPGGIVETYDKPITAAEVMDKYPRHCVTRPDVFKNPWIVVRPESVLHPGDVFYVVPYYTIRRLTQKGESPKQSANQEQAHGSRQGERNNAKSSSRARTKHRDRTKSDLLGGQSVRDEPESCSYEESSFEAHHLHQFERRWSLNHDRRFENQKLGERGPGDRRSIHQFRHHSGVASSREQFSEQSLGKKESGSTNSMAGSNKHRNRYEFADRQYHAQERHVQSAKQPKYRYKTSAEVAGIHRLLRELSLNRESCKQCEADREDACLTNPEKMKSNRQTPDEFIDQRSASDFTFQQLSKDPKDIDESSPDLAPFRHLLERRSSADAREDTKNYNLGGWRRGDSTLKHPLNESDPSKELAPKKHENSQLIRRGSYSYNEQGAWGNGDGLERPEIHRKEFRTGSTNGRDLLLVNTHGKDLCDSHETLATLKSCMKKKGLRLRDPRVKFNLPGEDKNLRVEVFKFQPLDSP